MRVCAYAQTRQSLQCSHTRSMDVIDGSDQKLDTCWSTFMDDIDDDIKAQAIYTSNHEEAVWPFFIVGLKFAVLYESRGKFLTKSMQTGSLISF